MSLCHIFCLRWVLVGRQLKPVVVSDAGESLSCAYHVLLCYWIRIFRLMAKYWQDFYLLRSIELSAVLPLRPVSHWRTVAELNESNLIHLCSFSCNKRHKQLRKQTAVLHLPTNPPPSSCHSIPLRKYNLGKWGESKTNTCHQNETMSVWT